MITLNLQFYKSELEFNLDYIIIYMKTINDFSKLMQAWLVTKSKINLLKTKRRINLTLFQNEFGLNKQRFVQPLYKFDQPTCLTQWIVLSDQQYGGDSEADIGFTGKIYTQDALRMVKLPSIGIKPFNQFADINIKSFNILNVKIKTNGDIYRVVLKLLIPWIGDYKGQALIVTKSKELQELQIPIMNFQTSMNSQSTKTYEQFMGMNDLKLASLEFYTESNDDKDVELQIKQINLVYEQKADIFAKKFRRKTFYKPIIDYANPKVIDDGRDVFIVK